MLQGDTTLSPSLPKHAPSRNVSANSAPNLLLNFDSYAFSKTENESRVLCLCAYSGGVVNDTLRIIKVRCYGLCHCFMTWYFSTDHLYKKSFVLED